MKKISFIVPAYNSEKTIRKCIDSLINQNQNMFQIEVIVVNDGSVDSTLELLNKYYKDKKSVSVFTKKNGGQASARNLGLKKATGDYIIFIDSDDYISENLISGCSKYIDSDYDIIVFNYSDEVGKEIKEVKSITAVDNSNVSLKEYVISEVVSPCNKILKKAYLDKLNFSFPEGIIYEDYAAMPTLVLGNPKIAYVPTTFYYYVQDDDSTMRSSEYKIKYEDLFEATDYLYNKMKDSKFQLELEYIICIHNLYYGALNFFKYDKDEKIDVISNSVREKFPNWENNNYIKRRTFKEKLLMKLFFKKKYNLIRFVVNIKKKIAHF